MTVRIVTYNVRKGGRRRRALIADVLAAIDADVVVLQEATDPNVVRFVADAIGCPPLIHAPGRSVAVLTRLGPAEARWHRLARARSFVEVDLPGPGIRVLGVHLSAGLSAMGERRRLREIEHLLMVAGAPPRRERTVLAGDLNAIAPGDMPDVGALPRWIRLLLRADGGLSTIAIGRILGDGLVDAFRRCNPDLLGATMPALAPTVRLDYLMVGGPLAAATTSCGLADVDPALLRRASDHVPVVLDLAVPRG